MNALLMNKVVEKCLCDKIDFCLAEKRLEVEEHAAVASDLLKAWNMPSDVVLLAFYHHTKEGSRPLTLNFEQNKDVNILFLADLIAHRFGKHFLDYNRNTTIKEFDLEKIGLKKIDIDNILKTLNNKHNIF